MCHFVTGVVSGKITLEEINAVGREFNLRFQIFQNEFVQKQLQDGEIYIQKLCGVCDCDTPIGMLNRNYGNHVKRAKDSDIEKLKRKGWSGMKIQRYMDGKNKKAEQVAKAPAESEIRKWTDFLEKLFAETSVKAFGILLHFYSGGIEAERTTINKRVPIKKSELTARHLLEIEEDALYIVA